jgi:hypothetical protein
MDRKALSRWMKMGGKVQRSIKLTANVKVVTGGKSTS